MYIYTYMPTGLRGLLIVWVFVEHFMAPDARRAAGAHIYRYIAFIYIYICIYIYTSKQINIQTNRPPPRRQHPRLRPPLGLWARALFLLLRLLVAAGGLATAVRTCLLIETYYVCRYQTNTSATQRPNVQTNESTQQKQQTPNHKNRRLAARAFLRSRALGLFPLLWLAVLLHLPRYAYVVCDGWVGGLVGGWVGDERDRRMLPPPSIIDQNTNNQIIPPGISSSSPCPLPRGGCWSTRCSC